MAETLVDNETCAACGTEIRTGALFCYHCGAAVMQVEKSRKNKKTGKLSGKTKFESKRTDSKFEVELDSKKINENLRGDEINVKTETNGKGEIKLRSAAAIRNKTRRLAPKKIEIHWEEHENAPNVWFIGVSIGIMIFTLFILLIAMYLK